MLGFWGDLDAWKVEPNYLKYQYFTIIVVMLIYQQ